MFKGWKYYTMVACLQAFWTCFSWIILNNSHSVILILQERNRISKKSNDIFDCIFWRPKIQFLDNISKIIQNVHILFNFICILLFNASNCYGNQSTNFCSVLEICGRVCLLSETRKNNNNRCFIANSFEYMHTWRWWCWYLGEFYYVFLWSQSQWTQCYHSCTCW